MADIIEDYLRAVSAALGNDAARGHAIHEMRAHLQEKADDIARDQPDRARADIEREVVNDFGSPADLAIAYRSERPVVERRSSGEVVLEMGRAVGRETGKALRTVGRGTGRALKVFAIVVAILLVSSIGVGVWAFHEVKPIIEKNVPIPVYSRSDNCKNAGCNMSVPAQAFYVNPEAREVRLTLDVHHSDDSLGVFTLRITDPSGEVVYQEDFPANGTHSAEANIVWAPQGGKWQVELDYQAFKGRVDVMVLTVGLPRGSFST